MGLELTQVVFVCPFVVIAFRAYSSILAPLPGFYDLISAALAFFTHTLLLLVIDNVSSLHKVSEFSVVHQRRV